MIRLVAFDWNGTLLSDTAITLRSENVALKAVGRKPITLLEFQKAFDIPITKYWKNLGMTESFFKKHLYTIEDVFHSIYEKNVNSARTRSGVKGILNFLKKSDIGRVIYSNHNVPNIHRQLVRLKIDNLIDHILANKKAGENAQVFVRHKEHLLNEYIKQKKIKPKEVVSVGDTVEEIEIGKAYGYHTVALSGGYNTTTRLKKHRPDFLVHNLAELKNIVRKLNQ